MYAIRSYYVPRKRTPVRSNRATARAFSADAQVLGIADAFAAERGQLLRRQAGVAEVGGEKLMGGPEELSPSGKFWFLTGAMKDGSPRA